ncbi:hypothetical protein BP5796_05734 [Coleophoma crateriformis]|uniref:Receptor L-domain domain-containing protein n=1 Tax=Coleophoma crateriformis TaxID=565419 RepID=A0A3D8RUY4_9HELO|nr:hypothetical protein BP5796_05734 [Coleophoma crateriformis]
MPATAKDSHLEKGQCDASGINNIAGVSDTEALLSCTSLTGSLGIDFAYSGSFALPNINYIGGSFYAGDADPGSASNPTPPIGATPGIASISLPNLKTVEVDLEVTGAPYLESLSLPELTAVGGYILFLGLNGITDVSLPALETIGYSSLFDGAFDSLSFGSLKTVASLSISTTGSLNCTALGEELQSSVTFTDASAFLCDSSLGEYRFDNTETTPPTTPSIIPTSILSTTTATVQSSSIATSDLSSESISSTLTSLNITTTPTMALISTSTTGSGSTPITTVATGTNLPISTAGNALAIANSSITVNAVSQGNAVSTRLVDSIAGLMTVVIIGTLMI